MEVASGCGHGTVAFQDALVLVSLQRGKAEWSGEENEWGRDWHGRVCIKGWKGAGLDLAGV